MTLRASDLHFLRRALAYALAAHEKTPADPQVKFDIEHMNRILRAEVGEAQALWMIAEARKLLTHERSR